VKRLSSADAQYLAVEDGRTHTHVCHVTMVEREAADGSVIDAARLRDVVAERIHLLPPFRWRLKEVPFNLDYPVWVDDPEFDLAAHIADQAVPAPGDERRLGELIGVLASRPLDRSRPLWEMHVIHGVAGDRTAIVTKVHHALVDGVSGMEMLGAVLDLDPAGRDVAPAEATAADPSPSDASLLLRGIAALPKQPLRAIRALPATLRHIDQLPTMRHLPGASVIGSTAERAYRAAGRGRDGQVLAEPVGPAPSVSFGGPISAHRRFAFGSLSLTAVKSIKNARPGTTVNDVVIALCAGALRRRMDARGDALDEPLVALVPISVRSRDQDDRYGNYISSLIVPIPTDEDDATRRLDRAHETMLAAKERHQATPATLLTDANHTVPPALFARVARMISASTAQGWIDPPFNVTISNVPGPPIPLYLAGARVVSQHPVNLLIDGVGLSITLLSHEDRIDVGLTGDRELMPDVWDLLDDLLDELAELSAALGAD
jgi:diacylglycerol O-acyltransferase